VAVGAARSVPIAGVGGSSGTSTATSVIEQHPGGGVHTANETGAMLLVPEPSSVATLCLGMIGAGGL
jgi:hypothetical protein